MGGEKVSIDYQLLFGVDKQLHFASFAFISTMIGIMILLFSDVHRAKYLLSISWMTLVSIGIVEEYRQFLLPDRSTEFLDAMANMLGVTAGLAIPILILYVIEHKRHFLSGVFRTYSLVLVLFLLGLLILNERPFFALEENLQERVRDLSAFIKGDRK